MVFFHLLGRQDFIVLTLGFVAPLHLDGGTQGAGDPDFRCRRVDTAGFTCNSQTRGERDGPREGDAATWKVRATPQILCTNGSQTPSNIDC